MKKYWILVHFVLNGFSIPNMPLPMSMSASMFEKVEELKIIIIIITVHETSQKKTKH